MELRSKSSQKANWEVQPSPDGTYPDMQITHGLLLDIRDILLSIRKMAIYFTVISVIGLVAGLLLVLAHS